MLAASRTAASTTSIGSTVGSADGTASPAASQLPTCTNVARGKPTRASSIARLKYGTGLYGSRYAVDGVVPGFAPASGGSGAGRDLSYLPLEVPVTPANEHLEGANMFHSGREARPWLAIDLGVSVTSLSMARGDIKHHTVSSAAERAPLVAHSARAETVTCRTCRGACREHRRCIGPGTRNHGMQHVRAQGEGLACNCHVGWATGKAPHAAWGTVRSALLASTAAALPLMPPTALPTSPHALPTAHVPRHPTSRSATLCITR